MKKRKAIILAAATLSLGVGLASVAYLKKPAEADTLEGLSGSDTLQSKIATVSSLSNSDSIEDTQFALSTKKLIIATDNSDILNADPGIESYEFMFKNIYVATYKSEEETANAYIRYMNDENITVMLDEKTEISRYTGTGISWGVSSMKQGQYADLNASSGRVVRVAVADTGVLRSHVVFTEGNNVDRFDMSLAIDYIDNDNDPSPIANGDHGTGVAGLITQSTSNNVKIVPVRTFEDNGTGNFTLTLYTVRDLAGKVDIINFSNGGKSDGNAATEQMINNVMLYAREQGTLVVAASGNDGGNVLDWPAASPYVVGVGSVDQSNNLSSFSDKGTGIDFVAPGSLMSVATTTSNSSFISSDGTSYSTPFIAAAAANILSEKTSLSALDAYEELKKNAKDLGVTGYDTTYGWGSVAFNINRFADLSIPSITIPTAWTNQNVSLNLRATSSAYNVTSLNLEKGNITTLPTTWASIPSASKTYTENRSFSENGTYTLWLKNSNGENASRSFTISNIDKVNPTITTQTAVSTIADDKETATITVSANDTLSGLKTIAFYHRNADKDTNFTSETATISGKTANAVTRTLSMPVQGNYEAYFVFTDAAGNRVQSQTVKLAGGPAPAPTPTSGAENANSAQALKTLDARGNPNTSDNLATVGGVTAAVVVVFGSLLFVAKRRR